MTQVDTAIQSLVIASAELRYLALENPSCEIEYRAIAEALACIAAEVKASATKTDVAKTENEIRTAKRIGNLRVLETIPANGRRQRA